MKRLALLVAFLVFTLPVRAQVKLLRHPTYHNGKIAFSYLGDIWTANEDGSNVHRLTIHEAREIYPRFSPDGKWIAYSSNRYGNYDVFIIPAEGGESRQLTFQSGNDLVVGWTPDSGKVIFQAVRGRVYPGIPSLYEVSIEGGLEQPLPADWGYWGSYSPDGNKFAFNRHPMVWWRKHYRGSYAADLWVMDVAQRKFTRLGDDIYHGNYFWPMYGAKSEICFVSDRLSDEAGVKPGSTDVLKSVNNLWKISERGGAPVQLTRHTDGNLLFPSISSDGRLIVYEENFGLWKLDTTTGKTSEIKIRIVSDDRDNPVETLTVRGETDGYSLSPSTKRAAISVHGEIFTIATDKGDVQQVSDSFSRETQPSWSPDGKWTAFVSDRSGRDEVWTAHEDSTGLKQLSNIDTEKQNLQWSPDSKTLLYAASDHKLYRVDLESGNTQVITSSEVGNILGARFSPDGKWVAYSKLDRELRPHVYVTPATGGEEHHLANDALLFAETEPEWTRDGKKLLFLAGVAQLGSATTRRNFVQLYSVSLQKEEKSLTDRGVDTEQEAAKSEREERARRSRGESPAEGAPEGVRLPEVKIEFDGIARRAHQLTRLGENVLSAVASPDSKLYALVTMGEEGGRPVWTLYTVQEDGSELTRILESRGGEGEEFAGPPRTISSLSFSRDGRTLYFLEGNTLNSVSLGTSTAAGARPMGPTTPRSFERRRINFTVRVQVNHRAERKEVFAESWRIMKNRFYDPKMHGVDWTAVRQEYEPLMDYVADQEEMHNVISEMIGELNASHTGISAAPTPEERERMAQTRYPGFELEPDPAGYYKVSKVYRNGPADKDYVRIAPGDYILAIDGNEIKSGDNYWKYYNIVRGTKIEFTVNSKPTAIGAWKTRVEPVSASAYATLEYEDWVEQRRQMVEKLSNGEIGYLHIRQMNLESLRKFERDLVANHAKKALIIDQRFNPGGGIDQELLEILGQRQYQRTRARDSIEVTRPQQGFFGPMVVMQNERSTSDAEVFPDGFRTLGLGKIVGTQTYGAVIGTGAYRLLDGSSIRTPAVGLWNVHGYKLENYGVPPDIYVDNSPEDFLAGRDAQLEKAVEVLLEELQSGKRKR